MTTFIFYCLDTDRGAPFRAFLNEPIVAALPYGLYIQLPKIFATHHGTKILLSNLEHLLICLNLSKLSLLHVRVVRKY